MPKVSSQHIDRRRQQILQAAFRCFARKGFHQTTMREICREAKLSRGGVYCHFESKYDIIQALARWGREQTRGFLDRITRGENAVETLQTTMTQLIDSLGSKQCLESARLDVRLWGEALHDPQIRQLFLQGLENISEPFRQLVEEGKREGQIEPGLPEKAAARLLVAVQLGLLLQKAIEPGADTQDCAAVISLLLEGMRVREKRS